MDKKSEPHKTVEKPDDDHDHGVITAGPEAHERERPGHTPPGDRSASKSDKPSAK